MAQQRIEQSHASKVWEVMDLMNDHGVSIMDLEIASALELIADETFDARSAFDGLHSRGAFDRKFVEQRDDPVRLADFVDDLREMTGAE
jgi:hypothetical protein